MDGATTGSATPTPDDLRSAIEVVASFVSSCEAGRYDGTDAVSLVKVFARGKKLCAAGETLAGTRAAQCNAHRSSGHRSPAEWLASVTGASVGEAADLLKVGEALSEQPRLEEALREGRLTPTRARLISAAARVNPRHEADLVEGAESDTFRQLKDRCLRARAQGRSAEEADAAHAAIHAQRRCRTWTDEQGAFRLDALLTPEAGATLLASLKARSERLFNASRRAGIHEPSEAYAADALVALVSDTESQPNKPTSPGPRSMVQVRVDLAALRRGSVGDGETCEIPGVGPVPVRTARELIGDAWVDLVITDGVDVTTICRMGRSIPTALRTAITERDRSCVVPGCDATKGLEFDHWQTDFADGGPLSMDNLARLCRYHHYLRTHQGFVLSGGPGKWDFDPPEHPKPVRRRPKPKRAKRSTGSSLGSDPPLFTVEA
jgi:hypothetical protein